MEGLFFDQSMASQFFNLYVTVLLMRPTTPMAPPATRAPKTSKRVGDKSTVKGAVKGVGDK